MFRWLARLLRIKTCPYCHHWSPFWCNAYDWYGDGEDCSWAQFRREADHV